MERKPLRSGGPKSPKGVKGKSFAKLSYWQKMGGPEKPNVTYKVEHALTRGQIVVHANGGKGGKIRWPTGSPGFNCNCGESAVQGLHSWMGGPLQCSPE